MWIRTASERDLDEIRALLVTTWHDTYDGIYGADKVTGITDDWHAVSVLRKRLTQPGSEFVVADNGEKICAVAFASTEDGKSIVLHQLYVLPQFQGQGAGGLLLDEIKACFPEGRRITLEVEERNANAIRFYENKGFREIGRTGNCGGPDSGMPALILELELH